MKEKFKMEFNKIYFIQYSRNVQLVIRFREEQICNYIFFDHLHYWNGFETFHGSEQSNHCVKSGIEEIREATLPEKHLLLRHEIEHNLI